MTQFDALFAALAEALTHDPRAVGDVRAWIERARREAERLELEALRLERRKRKDPLMSPRRERTQTWRVRFGGEHVDYYVSAYAVHVAIHRALALARDNPRRRVSEVTITVPRWTARELHLR